MRTSLSGAVNFAGEINAAPLSLRRIREPLGRRTVCRPAAPPRPRQCNLPAIIRRSQRPSTPITMRTATRHSHEILPPPRKAVRDSRRRHQQTQSSPAVDQYARCDMRIRRLPASLRLRTLLLAGFALRECAAPLRASALPASSYQIKHPMAMKNRGDDEAGALSLRQRCRGDHVIEAVAN